MAHFSSTTKIRTRTPKEWLGVGAQIGEVVNMWAARNDIVAYVGASAGKGIAPALFNPASAEVEVNIKAAFGHATPAQVGDLRERSQLFEFPKAAGAMFHEALHARYSNWDMETAYKALTRNEFDAMHLLEESRIEYIGVQTVRANRVFLRACALEIVLGDVDETLKAMTQTRQAAHLAALTYGRVTAGVLVEADILAVAAVIDGIIPAAVMGQLRAIWTEFQTLPDHREARMYDLARQWNRLVQDAAEEAGEGEESADGAGSEGGSGSGEAGDGSGDGSGLGDLIKAMMEALAEDAEATGVAAHEDLERQETTEKWQEEAKAKAEAVNESASHKEAAGKIFQPGVGSGPASFKTSSTLRKTRKPTAEERVAAVTVAKQLEKAKYRDRTKTVGTSVVPPGRLRTRAMVQAAALKAKGIHAEVEPWRRVMRKHTDDPNLTVGVMVDISGSMGSAMEPMASTAWIMSEAVRRVQGRAAMVYYGNDVFPTLKPGEHLTDVKVYDAPDGTERFDLAFKALDGALNLINGSGARLLVIVSDGAYTGSERKNAEKWLKRCQKDGIGVLWLGFGSYSDQYAGVYAPQLGAHYVGKTKDVAGAAIEIGKAAEKALTMAGQRNGM